MVSEEQTPGQSDISPVEALVLSAGGTDAGPAATAPIEVSTEITPEPEPQPQRPRRKRRVLLLSAIVAAVLVVLSGTAGLVVYDQATKIDRSTPVVSVQQLLTAIFVEDDLNRTSLFLCDGLGAAEASSHAKDLVGPEAKVSWGTITATEQSDKKASVQVHIRLLYPGDDAPSGGDYWQFALVNTDGWRVCSFGKTV